MTDQKSQNPQVLFFAGALSGVTEAFAVQPFDMVKTRHQLNAGSNETVYVTLLSLHAEGGFGRFYRGMLPELIGMVPKSSGSTIHTLLTYKPYSHRHAIGMYATYEIVRSELAKTHGDTTWVAATGGISCFPPR